MTPNSLHMFQLELAQAAWEGHVEQTEHSNSHCPFERCQLITTF